MPAGGFGNLIALPLQHARRADGCTLFLDDDLQPYPDQWSYLAAVQRLDREHVDAIVGEADHSDGALGLNTASGSTQRASRPLSAAAEGTVTVSLEARLEIP